MGCLLDHCWVCNGRCVSRGQHRCGSCQVPEHLPTGPPVRQDCLCTQSRAGAGSPVCVRIYRQDHGLWVYFHGHGWAWLFLPPLAVELCVVQSVRLPFGRSAWTCILKVLSLISGFTRVSQLPPRVLEFPLLSVGGDQIVVCVGACESGPLIPQSCCCRAMCSQHSIQRPWVMTAPDQCAAVLNTRVLTVVPETMTFSGPPSPTMFLTFSPTVLSL